MEHGREFGQFLQTRRARLRPEELGLPVSGRRRVAGLRRDEAARLAGVSVEYYVRLEQGRAGRPSDEVLAGLAAGLRLEPAAREHLFRLALPHRAAASPATGEERLRPTVRRVLAALPDTPAVVYGRRLDVLAQNAMATAVLGTSPHPGARNCPRNVFLDPAARTRFAEWDRTAQDVVALLRRSAGQHPGDPGLAALVDELRAHSPDFARLWAAHDVRDGLYGSKRFRHPRLGEFALDYETLTLPDDPRVMVAFYTAAPGTPRAAALAALRAEPTALPEHRAGRDDERERAQDRAAAAEQQEASKPHRGLPLPNVPS